MKDERDRRSATHYAGDLYIRKGPKYTMILTGTRGIAVCFTPDAHVSVQRQDVTCKRCLVLIAKHDRTKTLPIAAPVPK